MCVYLRYDYNLMAFACVIFHDFLDHLDGIVATVQRVTYPNHDDSLLGGFLDAFCDKIVNVFSIWTIIQTVDLESSEISETQLFVFLAVCYGVIAYEVVIGVVRVEDYFLAKFKRYHFFLV
jgi:phosphatidylglycerophosphate synthase